MLLRTSKLTRHYQLGNDGLTKCVRLFRYFYRLVRKSLNGTSQEKYFDFRKSLVHFGALISDEHFCQVSLKSDKSIYPINTFETREKWWNYAPVGWNRHVDHFRATRFLEFLFFFSLIRVAFVLYIIFTFAQKSPSRFRLLTSLSFSF